MSWELQGRSENENTGLLQDCRQEQMRSMLKPEQKVWIRNFILMVMASDNWQFLQSLIFFCIFISALRVKPSYGLAVTKKSLKSTEKMTVLFDIALQLEYNT